MKKVIFGFSPPLVVAAFLVLALTNQFWAGGNAGQGPSLSKAQEKQINDILRDVINRGAKLFNEQRDYQGCYRLFEGSLVTIRPLIANHKDLQTAIDKGIMAANATPDVAQKAFELRKAIDQIREKFGGPKPPVKDKKPADVKPVDKKPTDKKPADVKPVDKKPVDKKPADKKPTDKKPADKVDPKAKTLWERLGGESTVAKVVDDFIATASKDPKVNFDKGGKYKIDVKDLRKKLIEMVSHHTGGPYKYTGKSMAEAHKGMKVTDAEFTASVVHLKAALEKNGVKPAEANEVLKIVESTRKDIVQPGAAPPNQKDKKDGQIKGKVMYKGKPAPAVLVTFISDSGDSFSTNTGPDGTYSLLTGIPAGKYRVTLRPLAVKNSILKNGTPQDFIPSSYTDADTSSLTVEVRPGNQVFDFDLK